MPRATMPAAAALLQCGLCTFAGAPGATTRQPPIARPMGGCMASIEGSGRRATVSVEDAAARLGVKQDSIRARLRRGSLQGKRTDDGWLVYVDSLAGQDVATDAAASRAAKAEEAAEAERRRSAALSAELDAARAELVATRAMLDRNTAELAALTSQAHQVAAAALQALGEQRLEAAAARLQLAATPSQGRPWWRRLTG